MKRFRLNEDDLPTFREWQFQSGHRVTNARQQRALVAMLRRGGRGVTALELARRTDPTDETAIVRWAPAFSLLHKAGIAVKLEEKRDGYAVYVLPEHVNGRATVAHYLYHCPGCRCAEAAE